MRHARPFTVRRLAAVAVVLLTAVPASDVLAQTSAVTRLFTLETGGGGDFTPSPDGRWIAYAQGPSEQVSHLYVIPAGGGASVRITTGETSNRRPVFSPSGDRLYFVSTLAARAGDSKHYLMAMPFDTRVGRPSGPPRRITLDGVIAGTPYRPAVSPDGRWVAYAGCCDTESIRVVPANGGTARTLVPDVSRQGAMANLAWSEDGAYVLYTQADPARRVVRVMRVPATGGTPEEAYRHDGGVGRLAPGGRYSAQVAAFGINDHRRQLRLRDAAGRVVHTVALPNGFNAVMAAWSPDGRAYVGPVADARSVIRLAPTVGGPTRALTSGPEGDWPAAWSADGRELFFTTGDERRPGLYSVTTNGTPGSSAASLGGGDASTWNAVVGRWAVGRVRWLDSTRQRIVARHLDDGRLITLADASMPGRLVIRGPGGSYGVDGDAFVYGVNVGDRVEVRRTVPGGATRVLHAFSGALDSRSMGVHEGRLAYTERAGDSVRLMLATGGGAPPRRLATVPSTEAGSEIAWSRDGRHLVFGLGSAQRVAYVMALAPDATPTAPVRRVELPFDYAYEFSLLPDGRRMAMIAQPPGGPHAVAALVDLDDPTRPRILSQDDGTSTWGLMLSPDGEHVAYAAELPPRGTTVYRVDLSGVVGGTPVRKR